LILFLKATKRSNLADAGHVLQSEFYVPILQGTLFTEIHTRCIKCIPKDVSHPSTIRTQSWGHPIGKKARSIVKSLKHAFTCPVYIGRVIEDYVNEAHPKHR